MKEGLEYFFALTDLSKSQFQTLDADENYVIEVVS